MQMNLNENTDSGQLHQFYIVRKCDKNIEHSVESIIFYTGLPDF